MSNDPMVLKAVHSLLFQNQTLRSEVGNNIEYARGTITANWPLVHYFEVSQNSDRDMDFDRWTMQVSAWSKDKYQAARIKKIVIDQFQRLTNHTVTIGGDTFLIHRCDIVDAGALPSDDKLLFGSYVRFVIKYRGKNIGGN